MANLGYAAQNMLLNLICKGSAASPAGYFVALSTGVPTAASGGLVGEPNTITGYTRMTCTWTTAFGASSAANSAFNVNAMTFGPFSSIGTWSGIGVMDTQQTIGIGNPIWYGLLASARNTGVGDWLVLAASALTAAIA